VSGLLRVLGDSEFWVNAVFYVFAAGAIAGSVAVAASRNIVRSAFALLAVLLSAAAMYAIMKADFIAAAQILIYVGGILVLIIFAVMLTHRITDVRISNESTPGPAAFCACLCLLFSLVVVVLFTVKWDRGAREIPVRAGSHEVGLVQYQADGRTGLERGAAAIEERVVVGVRAHAGDLPKDATGAEFRAQADGHDVAAVGAPFGPPDGAGVRTARAELAGLRDGKAYTWWARLRSDPEDPTPWTPSAGPGPDFEVRRGITEPVAQALMGPYLFAFEVVSLLLLAALVGAAFLARKEVKD
jgi:NADH:ubiquinone oxidoreductase subunit 6 (subunit J)